MVVGETLRSAGSTAIEAAIQRLRQPLYSGYYRLVELNHDKRLYAPKKSVPGGSFRSYELIHRHGRDELLAALLEAIDTGDVVYDVGANTGVYSLAVAASEPTATVIGFEPNPVVAEQFRANVERNEFEDRITVRTEGLGQDCGTMTFYRSSYDELGSFDRDHASSWEASVVDTVRASVRTIDSLVETERLPPPDHLKIDVEGFAPEVLAGAQSVLAAERPMLYVEPHGHADPEIVERCRAAIEDANYGLTAVDEGWVCSPRTDGHSDGAADRATGNRSSR